MLHIKVEGGKLHNGLNIYGLSDWKRSRGFVWRWNGYAKWFRYSVTTRKWFTEVVRLSDHLTNAESDVITIVDLPRK